MSDKTEQIINEPKNGEFVINMEGSTQLFYLTVLTFIIAIFLILSLIMVFLCMLYQLLNDLGVVIDVILFAMIVVALIVLLLVARR